MTLLSWTRLVGFLAGEAAILVLLAGILARCVKPAWQRSIWHSVILGLSLLLVLECAGANRYISKLLSSLAEQTEQERRVVVTTFPPGRPLLKQLQARTASTSDHSIVNYRSPKRVWWPGWLWVGGAIAFTARPFLSRFWFLVLRRRRHSVTDENLRQRIKDLSHRLGLKRTVHVTESSHFTSPVVFGVLRLGLCLPERFTSNFTPAQRESMLAHELAHLASNDPTWYCLLDLTTAAWWWNPFIWWSRRQLQSATEQAADEASLLVEDGPGTLAECLVSIGRGLAYNRSFNLLGIGGNGFRSSLGRRVSRLLTLEGAKPGTMSRGKKGLVYLGSMGLLLVILIAASGWTSQEESLAQTAWDAIARNDQPQLLAQTTGPQQDLPHPNPYIPRPPALDSLTGLPTTNIAASADLHTRWFRVDLANLSQGLSAARRVVDGNQGPRSMLPPRNTNVAEMPLEDLRNFLKSADVDLSPPKTIFMNGHGMVMVRGTFQDLEIVEEAVQILNMSPPQLTIECKFVELGANTPLASWLQKEGIVFAAKPLPADRSTTDSSPASTLKVLTPALYGDLLKQADLYGTDILTPPKVITLSGHQAQIKVVDMKSVVTDLDYDSPTNGSAPKLQPIIEQVELGTVLDVIPSVSADGYTVSLTLVPSIKEFLGYDDINAKRLGKNIPDLDIKIPLPMFRHRVAPSSAVVRDGQTVLLYLGSVVNASKPSDPKKHRIVLVTPTVIDAAGNRVHVDPNPVRNTGAPPTSRQ